MPLVPDDRNWEYTFADSEKASNGPRRSRRAQPTIEPIIVKRIRDELEIKVGDDILLRDQDGSTEVGKIKELRLGSRQFIGVIVMFFLRIENAVENALPAEYFKEGVNAHEVFLTGFTREVDLKDIIDRAQVLSAKQFTQDIVIDESNYGTTFVAKRASNSLGDVFTDEFDYEDIKTKFLEDPNAFVEYIRQQTVIVLKSAPNTPVKPKKIKKEKPVENAPDGVRTRSREEPPITINLDSSEDEAEEEQEEEQEEETSTTKSKKRPRKDTSPTPRKKPASKKSTSKKSAPKKSTPKKPEPEKPVEEKPAPKKPTRRTKTSTRARTIGLDDAILLASESEREEDPADNIPEDPTKDNNIPQDPAQEENGETGSPEEESGDESSSSSEDEEDDDSLDDEHDEEDDDDDDDADVILEPAAEEVRQLRRKGRKPKDSKSDSKTKTSKIQKTTKTKKSDKDLMLEQMIETLSPNKKAKSGFKKGFKLKNTQAVPSLASLSPRKPKALSNSTSEAFKEIKAKLHASAKLNTSDSNPFLPGREDESIQILEKVSTAIESETGSCVYVSGTPGVGKTATIREVISQLQSLSESGDFNDFDYVEINGLKLLSPNVAYEKLWHKISGHSVTASNAAILLEKHFTSKHTHKPLVVLMDELDQIVTKNQNVMYNFFNWPSYVNSKLIVIAVANTMDLPERVLSNKISSRLGLNRIQFVGYTFDQLGEIIKHRLDMLTKQNKRKVIVKPDAIGFASRKVASVSGDARRALTICRRAVEIAESEYLESRTKEDVEDEDEEFVVQISHISKAINETINSPVAHFLGALAFESKLLLQAMLLRMKRSGLAENSLGDVIDEMKNSLQLLTSNKANNVLNPLDSRITLLDLLYSNNILEPSGTNKLNIRASRFKHVLHELVETGIVVQQNVPGERYRSIQLNISEEELSSALRRDKDILGSI